ncbi:sulfotransferase domain-containing protein [Candidatus Halocynthiibacter alkanivorans]|uniref:sulfotransferase domain-containing protein n=1 Tax=Candidatus Halocynthiibacter alkanivorans TaxID=2267619 RepID=UPI000DF18B9D|nr:sulfotransferase domain-containing protein [Candidatus Halocynthiibacter alkanivorans]
MRRLLLVSLKRSGTNWLQDIVSQIPGVLGLREIFNPRGAFGLRTGNSIALKHLRNVLQDQTLEEASSNLMSWIHADPLRALSELEHCAREHGLNRVSFTLFADQLPVPAVAALLSHPRTDVVILTRAQLPRYVSLLKARSLNVWKRQDTTGFKPVVDVRKFATEARHARSWFNTVATILKQHQAPRPLILSYEQHVLQGSSALLNELRQSELGFPTCDPKREIGSSFFRQDLNDNVIDAIENGPKFRMELEKADLLHEAFSQPVTAADFGP